MGDLQPGDPRLQGQDFDSNDFYALNFDDLAHAVVAMFQQLVVNDFFQMMEALSAVRGDGVRVFFLSYYALAVLTLVAACTEFIVAAYDDTRRKQKLHLEAGRRKKRAKAAAAAKAAALAAVAAAAGNPPDSPATAAVPSAPFAGTPLPAVSRASSVGSSGELDVHPRSLLTALQLPPALTEGDEEDPRQVDEPEQC